MKCNYSCMMTHFYFEGNSFWPKKCRLAKCAKKMAIRAFIPAEAAPAAAELFPPGVWMMGFLRT